MLINFLRILVIILGPVIGYFQISPDAKGILIGTGAAVLIIAVEIIIDRVALDALIAGAIGAILGLLAAQLFNWGIYQIGNAHIFELAQKYSLLTHVVF